MTTPASIHNGRWSRYSSNMKKRNHARLATLVKISIAVLWLALFAALLRRDVFITSLTPTEERALKQAEHEDYQAVYFHDKKIGYVINHYAPAKDHGQEVTQKAHLNLNILSRVQPIDLDLRALLSSRQTLKSFTFTFSSLFYHMSASGEVKGNTVHFTLMTGSSTIQSHITLSGPPMVPTVRRGYLLKQNLKVGDKVKVPWFDPVTLSAKSRVIEYRGRDRILINGRIHNLYKFVENFGGAWISTWLDAEGEVMKEQSPAGFVFIREPKFKALRLAKSSDELLSAVAVKVVGTMPSLEDRRVMRYRLHFPRQENFALNSGRQRYHDQVLTITRESLPSASEGPAGGACTDIGDSLAATPYIQAKAQPIVDQARQIVGRDASREKQVRDLGEWVYANLEKRPVLGIPDALTTLHNRRGDCNEHAALFAALARSLGIPTRIAAGVVYFRKAFYYHAWNEVCIDGRWLTIDTTTDQFPADLTHIKFVQGGLAQQVKIGALLGHLSIEPLPQDKAKKQ